MELFFLFKWKQNAGNDIKCSKVVPMLQSGKNVVIVKSGIGFW